VPIIGKKWRYNSTRSFSTRITLINYKPWPLMNKSEPLKKMPNKKRKQNSANKIFNTL
jgi:hypothetical protein